MWLAIIAFIGVSLGRMAWLCVSDVLAFGQIPRQATIVITEEDDLDAIAEKLIDSAGVVSGCGPAYMYMFAEALADGAVACGVPRAKALEYAAATLVGAGEMLLQTGEHPGKLKDNVCSPGGSTIAGVNILEDRAFRGAVIDCVKAAYKRNQELGK